MNPLDPSHFVMYRSYINWPTTSQLREQYISLVEIYDSEVGVYVGSSNLRRGARTGDFILAAHMTRVRTVADLLAVISTTTNRTEFLRLVIARRRQTMLILPPFTLLLRVDPIDFAAFGAEMTLVDLLITVQSVQVNGSAWTAGLRSGDRIIRIGLIDLTWSFDPIPYFEEIRRGHGPIPYELTVIRKDNADRLKAGQGPLPWTTEPSPPVSAESSDDRSVSVAADTETEQGADANGEQQEENDRPVSEKLILDQAMRSNASMLDQSQFVHSSHSTVAKMPRRVCKGMQMLDSFELHPLLSIGMTMSVSVGHVVPSTVCTWCGKALGAKDCVLLTANHLGAVVHKECFRCLNCHRSLVSGYCVHFGSVCCGFAVQ